MMYPAIKFIAAFVMVHMWYENACCGGNDCKPVPDGTVVEQKDGVEVKGWGKLSYSDQRLHWSQDDSDHLCVTGTTFEPHLVCVYRKPKDM